MLSPGVQNDVTFQQSCHSENETRPQIIRTEPSYERNFLSLNSYSRRHSRLSTAPNYFPLQSAVRQLMEMGFPRKKIENAIHSTGNASNIPAETLVSWLLEHQEQIVDASDEDSVTSFEAFSDSDSFPEDLEEFDELNQATLMPARRIFYRRHRDFPTNYDYIMYILDNVRPGMWVRYAYSRAEQGEVGQVMSIDDEPFGANVEVRWLDRNVVSWIRSTHIEILGDSLPFDPFPTSHYYSNMITVGDRVRVKDPIRMPKLKWGHITPTSTGIVKEISSDRRVLYVAFPEDKQWRVFSCEMERVLPSQACAICDGCLRRLPSSWYKCMDCPNFNFCEDCFRNRNHHHDFYLVKEFAGFSNKANGNVYIDDWEKCVKNCSVSSNESQSFRLVNGTCFWNSCTIDGKHYIELEMHPYIFVHHLYLLIDSDPTIFTSSVIEIKGGPSLSSMRLLKTICINQITTIISLLANVDTYYQFLTVHVVQKHNERSVCNIQGLCLIGYMKFTDDDTAYNFPFLSSDIEDNYGLMVCEQKYNKFDNKDNDVKTEVYVWGLNDKEQLGGLRGSKIKVPVFSENLSALSPTCIAGGSKSLFIVSHEGKVYACGEGAKGRLGFGHSNNVPVPRVITSLNNFVVRKVAVHSGGRHSLALTVDGKVFSWGEGDDGQLGHGNKMSYDKPRIIEALKSKRIRDIACGSAHSAVITSSGELYTWGLGDYGRLGHGDDHTHTRPKLVTAFCSKPVLQVSCGSRDAQTLALTEDELVYSWGDGDFGKLGRGGSEGCYLPQNIEKLNGQVICQIDCGAQFSVALSKSGIVWTWGKADYFRLGHGTDSHVRWPQIVEQLKGKKITSIAVGALHCLTVTDKGEVYAWGDNDHGQQGNNSTVVNRVPTLVDELSRVKINKVACGSSHSIAWASPKCQNVFRPEPVLFDNIKDPLGSLNLAHLSDPEHSQAVEVNFSSMASNCKNESSHSERYRPSLSKIISCLDETSNKEQALLNITKSLQISLAREMVISAFLPHTELRDSSELPASPEQIPSPVISVDNNCHIEHVDEGKSKNESKVQLSLKSGKQTMKIENVSNPLNLNEGTYSKFNTDFGVSSSPFFSRYQESDHHENECLTEFICHLTLDDARMLVDLLKLAVVGRIGKKAKSALSTTLGTISRLNANVAEMLLEMCITELEDTTTVNEHPRFVLQPVVQETSHPYVPGMSLNSYVKIPGAESLSIVFDKLCSTERRRDVLTITDSTGKYTFMRSGREWNNWNTEMFIPGNEIRWTFICGNGGTDWGWRFTVYPIVSGKFDHVNLSDRSVVSRPSIDLVISLLEQSIHFSSEKKVLNRMAAALAACAQCSSLSTNQRIWTVEKLRSLLVNDPGSIVDISKIKFMNSIEDNSTEILNPVFPETSLEIFLKRLPEMLLRQYEYESIIVQSGKQLMHSKFFKVLLGLCCDLELDHFPFCLDKWHWFQQYCMASRVAQSLIHRTSLPVLFCENVRQKIAEMNSETECVNIQHEDHNVFKLEHDEQLILWVNRQPEQWSTPWNGSGTIYGWGHNHRGQLGGVEGAKIKLPTPCESITSLRPFQIVGGEQTLFIVTAELKVYATGYGASGRLGIGGTESESKPTLLESLQHISIKKVAVNSGGKHCLALSVCGDVYSWGEGDDGKLGHGTKSSCDRPKLIEVLRNEEVITIACGGAHSACITSSGELYTWGKGRYGRLGHGDSEDHLYPKRVEALSNYVVVDVACGSGDAQTLCITDDDSVWSWGDGDYGKLGRGGSEGCKIPLRVDSLSGMNVIKVECGSQFSVALTKSGSIYTWGKGDYHRLGHGNYDHVRRPKKVTALHGKKIVCIAVGSLHCVACTDTGEVYTWGDNDEGQLGDSSTHAIQKPKLVAALQGKKINKVACGSAHTIAWSTCKTNSAGHLPSSVPVEYGYLKNLSVSVLWSRYALLYHFSKLFCSSIPLFDLGMEELRGLLVSSGKEAAFRKVVQATMVRDKQHGPVVELNRIQVKKSKLKNGLAGIDGTKSVFGQMVSKIHCFSKDHLLLPHRVWKVKLIGESVDDCGGGYCESIAEMCEELQNGSLPLLIQTPNGREETGTNRDCFLLNPLIKSSLHLDMFKFLGTLMGIAMRTGCPLGLNLAESVWKQIAGMSLSVNDIKEIDRDYIPSLISIRDMDLLKFQVLDMPYTTYSTAGPEIKLSSKFKHITSDNCLEYITLALNYRLHEFDCQVAAVREGMAKVVPVPLLSLFTGSELEAMVCGSPEIPISLLKSVATYKGIEPDAPLIQWFWEVMEKFNNSERSLFLRFVWGRTRLPRTVQDFKGRDFLLQILEKSPADIFLPESYTCFFLLKIPRYSCITVLEEKLKYAIHFCKAIDADEYARVAINDIDMSMDIDDIELGASDSDEDSEESSEERVDCTM